jgi:arsenical pump membrane protein
LSTIDTVLVWLVAIGAIAGILLRPKQWPEAVWACIGALLLVVSGLISVPAALGAVGKGTDVYLFLTGMMLLAELARLEGVFDWLAAVAVRASRGSRARLFTLVYAVGTLVTVFLSNDATAIVLTPAVYAAVKKARADTKAYLYICAFIANAASFVLPISNPANLVVFGKEMPPLGMWMRRFLLPSLFSIAATYAVLRWISRNEIRGGVELPPAMPALSREGKLAAWGIVAAGGVLMTASAYGVNLGLPTCAAAIAAVGVTTRLRAAALRDVGAGVSWSVLPLVAGLFVLVEALDRAGALAAFSRILGECAAMPRFAGELAASFGVAALSNLMNNLPSGLLAGSALRAAHIATRIRDSVMIGVDLGPNLSVTGSLATILWLIALRREGIHVSAWRFLRIGALVMPPALLLATLAVGMMGR